MSCWQRRIAGPIAAPLTVTVDRDSVAMDDSMESHRRELQFAAGLHLSKILKPVAPEIRDHGRSWVVKLDGETVAVWSVDHGVRLLCLTVEFMPRPRRAS